MSNLVSLERWEYHVALEAKLLTSPALKIETPHIFPSNPTP
jgi:hypothetical protein